LTIYFKSNLKKKLVLHRIKFSRHQVDSITDTGKCQISEPNKNLLQKKHKERRKKYEERADDDNDDDDDDGDDVTKTKV
jgi:hypothetical protein